MKNHLKLWIAAPLLVAIVALLLQACSGLLPSYETPTVGITSVRAVPSQGALPDFEIDAVQRHCFHFVGTINLIKIVQFQHGCFPV